MIRKSNFELLRIVAILMIIGLHYFNGSMGGALKFVIPGGFNFYSMYLFESLFIIAVNLFILTTGYFNINKSNVHVGKLLNLIMTAYFYGFIFYVISLMMGYQTFILKEFILSINPFLNEEYWFIKYYVILCLLSPFINILIGQLDKKMLIKMIIILLFLFSIWPSFLPQAPISDGGYGLMNFIVLYIIGGYLRNYGRFTYRKRIYFLVYIVCGIIVFLFSVLGWRSCWNYDFIFNIIGACSFFVMFSKLQIQSNIVNYLATFTFSIYLIHFNPFTVKFLYHNLLNCENYYSNSWFIVHFIVSILVIYIFSLGIELIRIYVGKLLMIVYRGYFESNQIKQLKEKVNKFLVFDFSIK